MQPLSSPFVVAGAPGRFWLGAALAAVVVSLSAGSASAAVTEDHPDALAIATLGVDAPKALPLMEAGDTALASGKFLEAAQAFDAAAILSPKSGMLRRKQCEALAAAGKRHDALLACDHAYALGSRSAFDTRKMVAVRVAAKQLPTPVEVYAAYDMASFAIRSDSSDPWGYAAMGDVANRLGDSELLARSLWQLKHVAPNHAETKLLEGLAASHRSSALAQGVRWLIALLMFGTLVHWLVARFKPAAATGLAVSRVPTP